MKTKKVIFIVLIIIAVTSLIFILGKSSSNNLNDDFLDVGKLKEDLYEKVNILSAEGRLVDLYKKDFNIDSLDYKLALTGILMTTKESGSIDDLEADKLYDKFNVCTNMDYISLEDVENKIKTIYGKSFNIDYNEVLKESDYVYDESNKRFYQFCISSLNKNNFVDTYMGNINITEEYVELYVSVAFGIEDIENNNIKVYKDYEYSKLYKEYDYDIENDFILDISNFEEFSQYKFTFKKKNNDYYFYSLENVSK